jgi:hypothetical protein
MIVLNSVHSWVANRKFSQFKKLTIYIIMFIIHLNYTSKKFILNRPLTLFDEFEISRIASQEKIIEAKDLYEQRSKDL